MSSYKPLPLKLGPKGARVLLMFTGDGVINAVFPERAADGGARHHLTRLAHTEAECSVARSWATASSTSSAARIPQRTRSQPARQSLRDTKTNSRSAAGDYGDLLHRARVCDPPPPKMSDTVVLRRCVASKSAASRAC